MSGPFASRPVAPWPLAAATGLVVAALLSACSALGPEPSRTPTPVRVGVVASATALSPAPRPAPATAAPAAVPAPLGQQGGGDRIEVGKCWTNATATTGGQLLISATSSNRSARLLAYRADGTLIGEVHNGGGQRYGGTVFAYQPTDPGPVTIRSSAGGSVTVPTTPFRIEN